MCDDYCVSEELFETARVYVSLIVEDRVKKYSMKAFIWG